MKTMNDIIHKINEIHSKASVMDKAEKLAYLNSEMMALDNLAYQVGRYIQGQGLLTTEERTVVKSLLDMINEVDVQRADAQREYNGESFRELVKMIAQG